MSITSICTVLPQPTEVYYCTRCGHLRTPDPQDLGRYYDTEYKILADSEDEDQIYQIVAGKITYRAEHQLDTLMRKVELPRNAAILDYGCAKGATLKQLLARRQDLKPHLFDVSRDYQKYWQSIASPAQQATYSLPDSWRGTLDAVISFFVLEHVNDPRGTVAKIGGLLRPGGLFYFIVPNVFANSGDFVVADHVNHFTPASIRHLLWSSGFGDVEIDDVSHAGAYVVSGRRMEAAEPDPPTSLLPTDAVVEIAQYWQGFAARLRAAESAQDVRSAIYGSGFYGTFIATCLRNPAAVSCFLDRNPHRWGKSLLDKPILPPEQLPPEIRMVYAGLNPARAREEIAKVEAWRDRPIEVFYP